jgi:uncharacterized membrane protein
MKIIRYLISLLELELGAEKNKKVYSEEELAGFAHTAMLFSFTAILVSFLILPFAFSDAVKAKRSKNPDTVKKAETAEIIAFFFSLPILLGMVYGIGSWLFSGTWFAIVPITIICFIFYKIKSSKKI